MKLLKNNIYINVYLKNKQEIFEFVFKKFKEDGAVLDSFLPAIVERDKAASVAIGNYLFLPHPVYDEIANIQKEKMVFIGLKDVINIDGQPIKFICRLALKGEHQMDALQSLAIAFSDPEEVEKLVKDKDLTQDKVLEFLAKHN